MQRQLENEKKALENAAAVVAASGGSTNAALHLPAIAHECGIEFTLFDVADVFARYLTALERVTASVDRMQDSGNTGSS